MSNSYEREPIINILDRYIQAAGQESEGGRVGEVLLSQQRAYFQVLFQRGIIPQLSDKAVNDTSATVSSEAIQPVEKMFSRKQEELLRREKREVVTLSKAPIKREEGLVHISEWMIGGIEGESSAYSQVAINPEVLFLPGSNNKPLALQEGMVRNYSRELSSRIPGVKAVIADAKDYVDLFTSYFDLTGKKLSEGKGHIRTETRFKKSIMYVSFVDGSVNVTFGGSWQTAHYCFVAPLIVPM